MKKVIRYKIRYLYWQSQLMVEMVSKRLGSEVCLLMKYDFLLILDIKDLEVP